MRITKTNNRPTRNIVFLVVAMLAMVLASPTGVAAASVGVGSSAVRFDTRLDALPLPLKPELVDLAALQTKVQRLQLLVTRLQHAINMLEQPEFDPATTPTLLAPLAELRVLFPDLSHRLCLAVSPVGPRNMPGFCSDAI